MAPLQQAQRQQSASSASLASEKESLRKEVENWKKRVTSLTASFNAVGGTPIDGLFGCVGLRLAVFFFLSRMGAGVPAGILLALMVAPVWGASGG